MRTVPPIPCGRPIEPTRSRSGLGRGSVNDLEVDALAGGSRGSGDRAKRAHGATTPADQAAEIGRVAVHLEHPALRRGVLAHVDGVGCRGKRPSEEVEQLAQGQTPAILSSLLTVLVGWAPVASQTRARSTSISIVDGFVCGL